MKPKYHILILAAGASRRLGSPKQLVAYNDSNLLNHVIRKARKSNFDNVLVVLGSEHNRILKSAESVDYVINENWSEGMGSSISLGVQTLSKLDSKGIMISVCDQPYLTTALFNKILEKAREGEKGIVTSDYGVSNGPPTYFDSKYFDSLIACNGDKGAKKILEDNSSDIIFIKFPKGKIDIDTQDDLKNLET